MDTLSKRLEQLAELQKKNIEPLQTVGGAAFSSFERMARKNYELMGDMVDYAVAQSRSSVEPRSPQELYERQMSEAQAFAERMSDRAAEYMALAEQMRGEIAADGGIANAAKPVSGAAPASTDRTTDLQAAGAKGAAKNGATKKAATKKTAARKATAKNVGAKNVAAKNSAATKPAAKKRATSKPAAKAATKAATKATAKRSTSKKASSKKTSGRSKRAGSKKSTSSR